MTQDDKWDWFCIIFFVLNFVFVMTEFDDPWPVMNLFGVAWFAFLLGKRT